MRVEPSLEHPCSVQRPSEAPGAAEELGQRAHPAAEEEDIALEAYHEPRMRGCAEVEKASFRYI